MKRIFKLLALLPALMLLLYAAQPLWGQSSPKVKRFKSNAGGAIIDTVAQDSAVDANAKLWTIGSVATGSAALSNFTGAAYYYKRILYFLKTDTMSTNDTMHVSFITEDMNGNKYRIPFTYCSAVGAETADAESLAVTTATSLVFMPGGNSANSFGPLKNVSMKVRINPTSVSRCIYHVSAQYSSENGD